MIYGIDLGTTFSAVAYVNRAGEPVVVPLGENRLTIPSAVLFVGENQVYVGEQAIERSYQEGSLLVQFAKRDIGLQNGRTWNYGGWEYKAEEISALILRKIAQQVNMDRTLPRMQEVVISHPQYFYMNQKEATKEAGELAGLKVVATITEPNAAAIAYGVYERAQNRELTVLVFDLGGGTFDVTLMRVGQGRVKMIGGDGDARLGGIDWDYEIVKWAKEHFRFRVGEEFDDVATPEDNIRLWNEARQAKEALSRSDMCRFEVRVQGMMLPVEITRGEFERMCGYLVERCLARCDRLFERTRYDWDRVDEILMVGGSTKMPMIQEAVRRASGKDPHIGRDPKLMVAKGAAIWGYWIREGRVDPRWVKDQDQDQDQEQEQEQEQEPSELEIPEVSGCTAHGLGVLVRKGDREIVRMLIPQNASTPCTKEETFYTAKDNATSILVPLYEGESEDPSACNQIGQVIIDGLPPRPRGQPVTVKFSIDVAGRLEVEVRDVQAGRREIVRVDRNFLRTGTSQQEVDFETRRKHLDQIRVF